MTRTIFFDGSCLGGTRPTGVERAFLRTLRAFRARVSGEILLCVPHDLHASIEQATRGETESDADLRVPGGVALQRIPKMPLAVWRSTRLPRLLEHQGAAVLWTPTTALPRHAPCPTVATVHEIPHPDAEDSWLRGIRQRRARLALARRATRIVVPSEHTAAQLMRESNALERRITIVPQPLNEAFLGAPAGEIGAAARRGFVFVGRAMRRKNLDRIAEAWRRLPEALRREHPLLWIGGPDRPEGHADFDARPTATTDELIRTLRAARGLVLASKSEGFGLPALEALACGCTPLVSEESPPADLCGELAIRCDPYDVSSIADGMLSVLDDEAHARRVIEDGPTRVRAFTADRSAQAWERILDELTRGSEDVAPVCIEASR